MPAPFTAKLIDEPAHPTNFEANTSGFSGDRWYLVDTDDPARAVNRADTPGIPVVGDPWGAGDYSGCLCFRTRAQRWGGRDEGARRGSTWVQAFYATPSEDNQIEPTEPGTKWTEIVAGETAQLLPYGLDPGDTAPINNGDGFNISVGLTQLVVVRNWPLNTFTGFARLNTLNKGRLFNDAPVTFPAVLGTSVTFGVAAEEAQFLGFTQQVVGRSMRITMTIGVGLSPFAQWKKRLPDGKYDTGTAEARVYGTGDFSDLW